MHLEFGGTTLQNSPNLCGGDGDDDDDDNNNANYFNKNILQSFQ
jgi:hypothetical protein